MFRGEDDDGASAAAYPLAPMQDAMLAESVLSDRRGLNVEQIVGVLDEALDLPRFLDAWRDLIARHGVLRTSFAWGRGATSQRVHPAVDLAPRVEDWRGEDEAARLAAYLAEDRAAGIDLSRAPNLRLALFRTGEARWVMVWTFHHVVLDGRGFTRALEEVFGDYDGAPPPPVDRPFADHVAAARALDLDAARAWFEPYLAGLDGPPRLPIARSTRAEGAAHRDHDVRVPARCVEALEALATEAGATLYTCVAAAWAIALARYAGQPDVVFGSTRSGRHTLPEAPDMLGCFINTLPLRVRVDEDETLGALLGRIRADLIAVRPFEQTPLTRVHDWSPVPRGRPLLTTNLVFERYLMTSYLARKGGPWAHRRFEVHEEGGFPLTVAAYLDGDLLLRFEHDPGLYPTPAIARLGAHVANLLKAMAAGGVGATVAALSLTSPEEVAERLAAGRPRTPTAPIEGTFVDRFEARVRETPDAPAVSQAGITLSYAELDRRANRVAHALRRQGIEPDDRVAIALPRSPAITAAILGLMKSGAAWVALDPAYPEGALSHMLTDSEARVVITDAASRERWPGAVVVEELEAADLPDTPPPRDALRPDHLAYVVYTSGSTGAPKGVAVTHACVASHAEAMRRFYELEPGDRVLQFASFSFDVSVEELLPTWLAGAHVVLRTDAHAQSIRGFLERVAEPPAPTILQLPTAFWHELATYLHEHPDAALPPGVRMVVAGGEKASSAAYARFRDHAPGVRFVNAYGPSEATVTCTVYDPAWGWSGGPLPIGRPTDHARVYVLGPRREVLPIGLPGELFVGGPCVARGYLGRPELTAERFLDDPYGEGRIYATGDRVRWADNGVDLKFMGRLDRQLKVRGFRIEPGEVEAALLSHPAVDQAIVDGRDGKLVAWVQSPERDPSLPSALRDHVRARLPGHMTPSAIAVLHELPVKPGGKVDLEALATPSMGGDPRRDAKPRDPLEATVARLFAEVLEVGEVGPDDDFQDLGGHSLLALRLISRIEETTGQALGGAALANAPTPREVAALLRSDHKGWECLVPIQPEGSRVPIFGVHVLGVNGAFFRPLAEHLGPDQPIYGLTHAGREDGTTTVPEFAKLYADELERFRPAGPFVLAAVSLGSLVAIELARELRARGREVAMIGFFDALGPAGMESVGRVERARRHLDALRREGPRYFTDKVVTRVRNLREQVDALRLRAYTRLGLELPDDLRFLQFIEGNMEAAVTYEPRPIDAPVTLFRATEDVFYTDAFRRAGMGWAPYARGGLDVIDVPGDHLGMLAEPHVSALAEAMREAIDRAIR